MFRKSNRTAAGVGATLAAVSVVQFLVSLDLSIVNVAIPYIADGLGFHGVTVTWVVHAYAITFGGLLLFGGMLADRFGDRRVLILGGAVFALASLAAGFASEPIHLVVARGVQGVGAALMAPAALAALTTAFPGGPARARAFGVWGAMNAAGGAAGVLVGGLLVEVAGWRWVMFANVPMALIALAFAWRGIPAAARRDTARRPDLLGAVLVTAGAVALVWAIVGGADALGSVSAAVLAAALLVGFVLLERRRGDGAMLRLGMLASRAVGGANACNLLIGAAMASAFYFLSLTLQRVFGIGPALAGLQFLPFALAVVVGSVLAGRLGRTVSPGALVSAGALVTAVGFAWLGLVLAPDGTFAATVLGPSLIAGIGFGMCLGPVVSIATGGAAAHERGVVSGLLSTSRQLGAAVGLAVLGTAAGAVSEAETGDLVRLAAGCAVGFLLCAALLGVAAVVSAVLLRRRTDAPVRAGEGA